MGKPKGEYGPNKETIYVLGEIKHLTFCGMDAEFISQAIGRTPGSISKLLYKYNEPELASRFAAFDQRTRRTDVD